MKLSITLALFFITFGLIACQETSTTQVPPTNGNTNSSAVDERVKCEDPRPEVCTREFRPVCAKKDNGIRCVTTPCPSIDDVTYSNACTACSDPKVIAYIPGGACPNDQ